MKERLLRVPVLGTAIRMQTRYREDAADALAASIGFFGFLSLFPLIALALAVFGAVIGDSPEQQQRVIDFIAASVPALEALTGGDSQVGEAIQTIVDNAGTLGVIGAVTFLLAALRIASGAQQASAVVFRREVPSGIGARLLQLRAMLIVGVFLLSGAAVSGSVGIEIGTGLEGLVLSIGGTAVALVLDFCLFMTAYRFFTPGPGPAWRVLVPGSLLAAIGWVALKTFGTAYVTNQAANAENNYGALGSVIALLLLFYLAGRLYLYGAELAALLAHIDDVGTEEDRVVEAVAVPVVSPRPARDVPPEPADAAKLAISGVVLGVAAAVIGRRLGDRG